MKYSCIIFHWACTKLVWLIMPFIFPTFLERSRGIDLLSILCVGKLRPKETTETHNWGERARKGSKSRANLRKCTLMG